MVTLMMFCQWSDYYFTEDCADDIICGLYSKWSDEKWEHFINSLMN